MVAGRRGDTSSRPGASSRAAARRTASGTPSPPPGNPHPGGLASRRASSPEATENASISSQWSPAGAAIHRAGRARDRRGSWLGDRERVAAAQLAQRAARLRTPPPPSPTLPLPHRGAFASVTSAKAIRDATGPATLWLTSRRASSPEAT